MTVWSVKFILDSTVNNDDSRNQISRSQITPLHPVELLTSGVYIKEFDWAELQICVTSPYGVRAITAKKSGWLDYGLNELWSFRPSSETN